MIECIVSRGLDAPAKFAPTPEVRNDTSPIRVSIKLITLGSCCHVLDMVH